MKKLIKRIYKKLFLKVLILTNKPFILFDKKNYKIGMFEGLFLYIYESNNNNWLNDCYYAINTTIDQTNKKPLKIYINY